MPATAVLFFALLTAALPAQDQPVPPSAEPYRVGGEVTRPERIAGDLPVYTEVGRKARVQGAVIIETTIDEAGDVVHARILKGLPMGLDRAALEAVKTWKFRPATLAGNPVKVYYTLTVNFRVEESIYGPAFSRLLGERSELGALVNAGSYREAGEVLDRWAAEQPADPDLPLARCYLLLQQREVRAAWEATKAWSRSTTPDNLRDMLNAIGGAAHQWAHESNDPAARREILEAGLAAQDEALAQWPDWNAARITKLYVLREKLRFAADDEERRRVEAEIDRLSIQIVPWPPEDVKDL